MHFSFKLLSKLSVIINSNDCIRKIISKSIRINPDFIFKKLNFIKEVTISSEKMKNEGNHKYDYAHSLTQVAILILNNVRKTWHMKAL